jgi:hypothetical protein
VSGGMQIRPVQKPSLEQTLALEQEMFTKTVPVPLWMVRVVGYLLVIFSMGLAGIVLIVVWFMFLLNQNQESIKQTVHDSAQEVISSRK